MRKPSINGFSIQKAKTLPAEDGCACYAEVLFNGKLVGEFLDRGDGGMYSFYAKNGFNTNKIEMIVRSFPDVARDYGLGLMSVSYDIAIMVDELLDLEDARKNLMKLEKFNRDFVVVDAWKYGKHYNVNVRKDLTDAELMEELRGQLVPDGIDEYEVRRYRDENDLIVQNTRVTEQMLK